MSDDKSRAPSSARLLSWNAITLNFMFVGPLMSWMHLHLVLETQEREREEKVSRDATKTPMHITNEMTATIYTEANEKRKQIDSLHSIKVHFYVPSSLKKTYLHADFCHDQRECSVQRAKKGKRNCRRILIFRRHCKLFAWVLVMLNAVVSNHNRRWNNQTENSINM